MLIDYHLHNRFSPDSSADTRELLKMEQERGIKAVCLTNHAEWFERHSGNAGIFSLKEAEKRFSEIQKELEEIRPEFPAMTLGFGVELQQASGNMEPQRQFIKNTPFDCVLGSVHSVDGVVISTHKGVERLFEKVTEEHAYKKYFENLMEFTAWGHFDVAAHFDVVKKYGTRFYGPFKPEKYEKSIRHILRLMAQKGIGIELNTGSLHERCQELFPHPRILKWALEEGVKHFTLSSDAHKPEEAGKYVHEALIIAKQAGITHLSTYEKQKPTLRLI